MELKNSTIENSRLDIIKLKTIDKDIFAELIKENKVSLYRLSKSILRNEADVEDAISETILKAYKNILEPSLHLLTLKWGILFYKEVCYYL